MVLIVEPTFAMLKLLSSCRNSVHLSRCVGDEGRALTAVQVNKEGNGLKAVWVAQAPLGAQTVKKLACNTGDPGSAPGLGRAPGE